MPVRIPIEPAGILRGVVVDPLGSPVAGARVAAARLEPSGGFRWDGLPRSAETGSNGAFLLRGLLPGRYTLAAFAEGLGPAIARKAEVLAGKSTRVPLALTTETAVAGRVVDEDGSAVPQAVVVFAGEDSLSEVYAVLSSAGYGRGRTDENGRFRVGSLLPGKYHAQAVKAGRIWTGWLSLEVPTDPGPTDPRFLLARGEKISGRVRDAAGRPESGAQVQVLDDLGDPTSRPEGWKPTTAFGTTEVDGSFRITGLGGGPYLVQASREGVAVAEARAVEAGKEDVELVLGEPLGIAGRVRDAETGEPLRRFWAILERRRWPVRITGYSRPFVTADGMFLHRGLP
ncbi:MAG: MSCRAMM family protein, partial [Planctomycetota bacterium]